MIIAGYDKKDFAVSGDSPGIEYEPFVGRFNLDTRTLLGPQYQPVLTSLGVNKRSLYTRVGTDNNTGRYYATGQPFTTGTVDAVDPDGAGPLTPVALDSFGSSSFVVAYDPAAPPSYDAIAYTVVWDSPYEGSSDRISAIAPTNDGTNGVFFAGYTSADMPGFEGTNPNPGINSDSYIELRDASGALVWSDQTPVSDVSDGIVSVSIDSNGDLYVSGYAGESVTGTRDSWIRKYKKTGPGAYTIAWTTFAANPLDPTNVVVNDLLREHAFDSDGEAIYLAVQTTGQWPNTTGHVFAGVDDVLVQKNAGQDTRITAPADVIDPENPPLTGVWKSWEGSNHEDTGILRGRPKPPDYGRKKQAAASGGRFLAWLVSGAKPSMMPSDAGSLVRKTPSGTSIPLVSAGSLADGDDREVHVEPMAANGKGGKGNYAWWVSGENQKARVPRPFKPKNDDAAGWSGLVRSHGVADPEVFGLESLLADASPAEKTYTLATADLYVKAGATIRPQQSFHDLSANSTGLLTNTATGGWRKDLSLLTESWNDQPASGLEFFNISPTEKLQYTRPASPYDYRPGNSMLYHWSDYRDSNLREFWARRGPIASWARIKDYATLYKKMTSTTTSAPNINHQSWVDDGTPANATRTFHEIRLMPQMARVQIVVSHYATTVGAEPGKFRPAVLYTPLVTVWNPYNTRLTLRGFLIVNPAYTLPLALNHQLSGAGAPSLANEYWSVQGQSSLPEYQNKSLSYKTKAWDMVFRLRENPMILEPGETRIFSPASNYLREVTSKDQRQHELFPGVRAGVGFFFPLDQRLVGVGGQITPAAVSLPGSVTMKVDAKFDVPSRTYLGRPVCGSAYQWFLNDWGSGRSHSWFQIFYDREDADIIYPPKLGLAAATLAECSQTPVPFLSMILGSRIANFRATATKGVVQADPVVDFFSSNGEPRFVDLYPGNDTLINCPWDFSVVEHSSGGDDMLPNVDNDTNSSYIVTGVRKAEGVSRIVAAELPTRPLASLADLTHMQIRALNPTPPYGANLVANSDASPLIPKDSIVNTSGNPRANTRSNEQQDDSYCANHVLFDDWFVSSIAPEPAAFGSDGQDLKSNFIDFLTGKDPLANRAYRPILGDATSDVSTAAETYAAHVEPADSWKTIASRLEVEGMFNVNSTSVKAWRALLGHARNQKIPYTQRDGSIQLSAETDFGFSRTSVAGDRKAGDAPEVAGEYADTTEFTGYRVFTDEMLDFLAEKIVEQVRLRGPFLSLSEFVNRQLSSNTELALGGAVQTALNALTANSSLNPFTALQNESIESEANPFVGAAVSKTGYVFPEAAIGHNTYGLPGWTRQADILRPLAPILSARDDTFTIRAYGDARSSDGKEVLARAWCEATVQRTRDFSDPSDAADITTQPASAANLSFGRKFMIVSFRWLDSSEL